MKLISHIQKSLIENDYVLIRGTLNGEEREFKVTSLRKEKSTPNVLHNRYDVYSVNYIEKGVSKSTMATDFHIRKYWKAIKDK